MRSLKAQPVVRFLPQLCDLDPRVAQLLREYVKDHTGLLFPPRPRSPRSYSNVYNRDLRRSLRSRASTCLEQEHIVFADFAPSSSEHLVPTVCESSGSVMPAAISPINTLQLLEDVERRKAVAASMGGWALKWRTVPGISTTVGWWRQPISL